MEEDDFIQREIRQQQMMMKQQDEGLEMLGQSAERLSKISMGIHEELGHQNNEEGRNSVKSSKLKQFSSTGDTHKRALLLHG